MSIIYRFKKERLADGKYAGRPRVLVALRGENTSIEVSALLDSGCDVTVIPRGIAEAIGLDMEGEKDKLYAYHESTAVVQSTATIIFLGKRERESVTLNNVPVLITLSETEDEEDVIIGLAGVFDAFDITFRKSQNKVIFKKVNRINALLQF